MPVLWSPTASSQLLDVVSWYRDEAPAHVALFAEAIDATIARIERFPASFPRVAASRQRLQRARVARYPYTIVFRAERDEVLVVALLHTARGPDSWSEIDD